MRGGGGGGGDVFTVIQCKAIELFHGIKHVDAHGYSLMLGSSSYCDMLSRHCGEGFVGTLMV